MLGKKKRAGSSTIHLLCTGKMRATGLTSSAKSYYPFRPVAINAAGRGRTTNHPPRKGGEQCQQEQHTDPNQGGDGGEDQPHREPGLFAIVFRSQPRPGACQTALAPCPVRSDRSCILK